MTVAHSEVAEDNLSIFVASSLSSDIIANDNVNEDDLVILAKYRFIDKM